MILFILFTRKYFFVSMERSPESCNKGLLLTWILYLNSETFVVAQCRIFISTYNLKFFIVLFLYSKRSHEMDPVNSKLYTDMYSRPIAIVPRVDFAWKHRSLIISLDLYVNLKFFSYDLLCGRFLQNHTVFLENFVSHNCTWVLYVTFSKRNQELG